MCRSGSLALVVTAIVLPVASQRVHQVIDFAGAAPGLAAAALVLLASLGGPTYAWGSAPIIIPRRGWIGPGRYLLPRRAARQGADHPVATLPEPHVQRR